MKNYLITCFLAKLAIFLTNLIFFTSVTNYTVGRLIFLIFFYFFSLAAIDAIVALIIHKLPAKWFNHNKKWFKVSKKERKFLEKLNIKKWKDVIPETGELCNFKKDKIYDINNNEYIEKFLTETCYAEVLHFLSGILGFVVCFIEPEFFYFIALPEAIVNLYFQTLPVLVQRYTRVRLLPVLIRNQRRNQTINFNNSTALEYNEEVQSNRI